MVDWARRNPGLALLAVALAAAIALYAPTLTAQYVNSDDNWLVRDNTVVRDLTADHVHTILFDLDPAHRFAIGVEYLPVRDLSYALDFAVWGDWLPGFHLTNLLLYLAAIALWFFVLDGFGVDRTVCGLAMLIWAVHPAHAQSVAWLAERKGLLGVAFSGLAALGYVRFRAGRSLAWLALGIAATVLAVWSKAHAAFAIAALAPLQVALPGGTRRRVLVGLGCLGLAAALAFVPVFAVMSHTPIIGSAPDGKLGFVLGVHGFYTRLAAMTMANAYTYPLATQGPSGFEIGLGAVALVAVLVGLLPRWPGPVRAGCALWLVGWFPVSHLLLPLQMILIADRYILVPSLGLALVVGYAVSRLPRGRALVVAVIAIAAAARAFVAQADWHDARAMWGRAVDSDPADANAWSMYAAALDEAGDHAGAQAAIAEGQQHASGPRLILHQALAELAAGDRVAGIATMRRAAEAGDERAMANYALLANDVAWARQATVAAPRLVTGWRALGKLTLAQHPDEARAAFDRALALEPGSCTNRYNLALADLALDRAGEALALLDACAGDAQLGAQVRGAIAEAHRRLTPR